METMKSDMGGAADTLAATAAIAELGLSVNVVGYMCLAENMPGGAAQRPSDIITIYGDRRRGADHRRRGLAGDGGRAGQVGADKVKLVVDIATLIGAASVALGRRTAGVMGSCEAVASEVDAVMREAGESAWAMPLAEELRKELYFSVDDLANVSGDRNGGMLVAGLFLREFVPDGVAWAHLDIAGLAFNEISPYGYTPKGVTGAAVRALVAIAAETGDGRLSGA